MPDATLVCSTLIRHIQYWSHYATHRRVMLLLSSQTNVVRLEMKWIIDNYRTVKSPVPFEGGVHIFPTTARPRSTVRAPTRCGKIARPDQ